MHAHTYAHARTYEAARARMQHGAKIQPLFVFLFIPTFECPPDSFLMVHKLAIKRLGRLFKLYLARRQREGINMTDVQDF